MKREETVFQILDFLTDGEMPFEAICEEMGQYHPQTTRQDISETLDYLLEENLIRISGKLDAVPEGGKPVRWHELTGKGKDYYYRQAKRRYPDD
jgi:hypothetical protein